MADPELAAFARQLGAWLIPLDEPCDYLLAWQGKWHLIEIKDPDKRGHADEFTNAQQRFHREASERGMPIVIWRTDADVLATLGARRAA
jgi:hypothetical protein